MEILQFNNLEIRVERKSFRRRISVYVYPDRPVTVRASKLASDKLILDFLKSKQDWIEKNYAQVLKQRNKWPSRKIRFCEKFPFRGQELQLRPVITLQSKHFFSKSEQEILLHVPRDDWGQYVFSAEFTFLNENLRQFYKRESIRHLSQRLAHFSKHMGVAPRVLRWSEPRTRWGSCSSRGSIQLNWRMIVFSDDIIDYIIVHELTHLKHMNHSSRFWGAVEEIISDYKCRMQELKDQQLMPEFLSFS